MKLNLYWLNTFKKIDVNMADDKSTFYTPLIYAISNNHKHIVEFLMSNDVNIDVNKTCSNIIPVMAACYSGGGEWVTIF